MKYYFKVFNNNVLDVKKDIFLFFVKIKQYLSNMFYQYINNKTTLKMKEVYLHFNNNKSQILSSTQLFKKKVKIKQKYEN